MDQSDKKLKWESGNLSDAWFILSTPQWENGKPILCNHDIEALGQYILAANREILALKNRQPTPTT